MPRISSCPHCDKKLKTPDDAVGRQIRCPACEEPLLITDDGLAAAEEEEKPPRRGRPREEDDRPRRSRKRKGVVPLWVWLAGGVLAVGLVVVVAVLVVVLGGNRLNNSPRGLPGQQGLGVLGQGDPLEGGFGQVQNGMTEQQVIDLLGRPIFHDGRGYLSGNFTGTMLWDKGPIQIEVQFSAGKVVGKKLRHGKPLPGGGWDYGP
jgi:hypothetical protein